jgi:hypothetical protein
MLILPVQRAAQVVYYGCLDDEKIIASFSECDRSTLNQSYYLNKATSLKKRVDDTVAINC